MTICEQCNRPIVNERVAPRGSHAAIAEIRYYYAEYGCDSHCDGARFDAVDQWGNTIHSKFEFCTFERYGEAESSADYEAKAYAKELGVPDVRLTRGELTYGFQEERL